ncbi:Dabb family protein [Algoriphagus namhaensis]
MKKIFTLLFVSLALIACKSEKSEIQLLEEEFDNNTLLGKDLSTEPPLQQPDSVLRHVVYFSFKDGSTEADIQEVVDAFRDLKGKIPGIMGFEWGVNSSPEGLNRGFTHAFILTFHSSQFRDEYLPHPDHKAFGDVLRPHMKDVLVVDYWARK